MMHFIYIYFGFNGNPIYVGETNDLVCRNEQHRRQDHWWIEHTCLTSERMSREEALYQEERLIKLLSPIYKLYNKKHNRFK